MGTIKEMFHYLRDDAKMAGIDIGLDAIRFVLLRTYRDNYSLQYEILNESVYSHDLHQRQPELREKIASIAALIGIETHTPVYLAFSHGIDIIDHNQKVTMMDYFNEQLITMPYEIKTHLTSAHTKTVYVTAMKRYVSEVISLLKQCCIPVTAVSFLPFSLLQASTAALSEDDWYETNGIIVVGTYETYFCIRAGYYVFALQRFPIGSNGIIQSQKGSKTLCDAVAHCFSDMKYAIGCIAREKNIVPQKMLLAGVMPNAKQMSDALSKVLHIPTMPWGIRGSLEVANTVTGQKQFLDDEPSLAIPMSMLSREVVLFEPPYYSQPIKIESFTDFKKRFRIVG